MEKIVVIGGGVMGSAIGIYLGKNGHKVNIWGTEWDEKIIREMKEERRHGILQVDLTDNVDLYYDHQLEEALKGTKVVVMAVISQGVASMTRAIAPYLNEDHFIISVSKGLDEEELITMSQLIENNLPSEMKDKITLMKLGGPIIAKELANFQYTEGLVACKDHQAGQYVGQLFKSHKFKPSYSQDIEGVDICSAFKNPYAIAMGMIEALAEGSNNPKAALMARGVVEMANIVEACGGSRDTAIGLAGVGDYYVTSQGGRNGIFGKHLGQGKTKDQALEAMNYQTVEGLANSLNGYKFLRKLVEEGKFSIEKDAPLFLEIYRVLYEGKDVAEAIGDYWKA